MEPPIREMEHRHQCVCDCVQVVAVERDGKTVVRELHDKCGATVYNPDQPFCNDCEQAGHPDLPQWGRQHVDVDQS